MRCIICDQDNWENVDEYRDLQNKDSKPVGMAICTSCGFISYPNKYKTKEEILEYYRKEYRGGAPTFNNLVTGQRKLHYHDFFLKEVFMKWEADKTKPVIGEVGAAIGMVLNMLKKGIPGAQVYGTELTTSYRNVASQEFGINLEEDLPKKEYDLLMTYKVAEHQMDVDKEFEKYHSLLKEDGYLYVSVPTWFGVLENFGLGGFDLEYYYHPDHINVWTEKLFRSLLKKIGFKIIKEDHFIYGDTYLCKKTAPQELSQDDYESVDDIKNKLKLVKECYEAFKVNDFDTVINKWPNIPMAYAGYYEKNRQALDKEYEGNGLLIADHMENMVESGCGDCSEKYRLKADILMRYGHYQKAAIIIDELLSKRPNMSGPMLSLSHCFREMAKTEEDPMRRLSHLLTARDICRTIIQVDPGAKTEAYNWVLRDNAAIPIDLYAKYINIIKKQQKQNHKESENEQNKRKS